VQFLGSRGDFGSGGSAHSLRVINKRFHRIGLAGSKTNVCGTPEGYQTKGPVEASRSLEDLEAGHS
jgi:hypothetical protein